jgi:hypothetical protein
MQDELSEILGRRAVTAHGGFGQWRWAVSRAPSDIVDLVHAAAQ